jgi:transcriptional regulator with XRE-family HTH domain
MTNEFSQYVRVARRKSGFTQDDVSYLLGVSQTSVSDMELGIRMPTVSELCALSLLYGQSFESLCRELLIETRNSVRERVSSLPDTARNYVGTFNREYSLRELKKRLAGLTLAYGA